MDAFDRHQDASLDAEDLQRLLLQTDTLSQFLTELARRAAGRTRHMCGITARGDKGPYTVASSDHAASQLDELQYSKGDGPCLEAIRNRTPVIVADMASEPRWGDYPQRAAGLGIRSSLSYPLLHADQTLGALNLYARDPQVPAPELQAQAAQIADNTGGALALALRLSSQAGLIDNLQQALVSRSSIDQAIGILMAQQRCDSRTAFGLLRTASQGRNMKLRDIAAQIVAGLERDVPGGRRGRY
jgi:GAF domain-containing protein